VALGSAVLRNCADSSAWEIIAPSIQPVSEHNISS
jgi:hypothetical protein